LELSADSGGHVGLTSDGLLSYRPARDFTGEETITASLRHSDGSQAMASLKVSVAPGLAAAGWSEGEHYMPARDADGWVVAEPGENHRTVHVSLDGDRFADGLTPGTATTPGGLDALLETLWLNPASARYGSAPASWHVLFERGQDFGDYRPRVISGEDALHPFVIGAYGEGDRPKFGMSLEIWREAKHVVVRDLAFGYDPEIAAAHAARGEHYSVSGPDMLTPGNDGRHENVLFENLLVQPHNGSMRLTAEADRVTFYRSVVLDSARDEPVNDAPDWSQDSANRIQGLFANMIHGLLIEENIFHHNGWEKGYREYGGAYDEPQPPSKYSHNVYISNKADDITFRSNVLGEASSVGAQLRSGAFVEGNLSFDNNVGFNTGSTPRTSEGWNGEGIVVIDNVVTEPSNKDADRIGARGWGAFVEGVGLVADLIAAQDGDSPDEFLVGVSNGFTVKTHLDHGPHVENVTVYNWGRDADETPLVDARDPELRKVTLDAFAAQAVGAGTSQLVNQWRVLDREDWGAAPNAEAVIDYFREGFGYAANDARAARVVVFEPDLRADGFRWDNRVNWTDDHAPIAGDAIDLDGHFVTASAQTLDVSTLDLGGGGTLRVVQGALTVQHEAGLQVGALGGRIEVDAAGQFLFNGYRDDDALTMRIDGGRVANSGEMIGRIDAVLRGGQMLLADGGDLFRLSAGSVLSIEGDEGRIGFDAVDGRAVMALNGGMLRFAFDENGVSTIREFASGRHGVAVPGVTSEVRLLDGVLEVDMTALDAASGRYALIEAGRIMGDLANIEVRFVGRPMDAAALVLEGGRLLLDVGDVVAPPTPETPTQKVSTADSPTSEAPSPDPVTEANGDLIGVGDTLIFSGLGAEGRQTITVDGGYVANTSFVNGVIDIEARSGEVMLCAGPETFRLVEGSSLVIRGEEAVVGYDAAGGRSAFQIDGGEVRFVFDEDGVSAIREVDSAQVDGPSPDTGHTIARLYDGLVSVDLSAIDPQAAKGRHILIEADFLSPDLGEVEVQVLGAPDGISASIGLDEALDQLYVDIF
jgi:hypothetical protein